MADSTGVNLLNSRSDQITYAYDSLLESDALFAMCFPASGYEPRPPPSATPA